MPIVLRAAGFEVAIYQPPREHGPAHVHIFRAGTQVVITLSPIAVERVHRMRPADVVKAVRIVEAHRRMLLRKWREIHG
jgi:hypothetical protein